MNQSLFVLLSVIPFGIVAVFLVGIFGYLLSLWKKDNSIADVLYSWHFIVSVLLAGFVSLKLGITYHGFVGYSLLLTALVLAWGLRLSWRIYQKNKGKLEDFRYATWRREWKWFKTRSYFQIYLLQGLIALVIVFPIALTIMFTPTVLSILYLLGVSMWVIGYIFEVIGDTQLDRFLKQPEHKGKLMTSGLWKFSRHPNYFGESLLWWGLWVASLGVAAEIWYISIVSPLLITFLLLKVSGIPLLEARMSQHPDWPAYAKKTNAFIPWFPRRIQKAESK